jgi:intracellular multiplication protein IcmO
LSARKSNSSAPAHRDIRPFATRLSQGLRGPASGLVLAIMAGVTWFEPAVIDLTVLLAALYALWVQTRAPILLMRLPVSAARLDPGNPQPGSRKPGPANGIFFIGWSVGGQEL